MATVGFALSSDLHLGSPARLNPRPRDPVNPGIGDLNPAGFALFSPSLPGFDHDDEPDPSDAFAVGGRATDAKIGELFTRWLSMAHTQAWLGPEVDALKNGVWAPALDGESRIIARKTRGCFCNRRGPRGVWPAGHP